MVSRKLSQPPTALQNENSQLRKLVSALKSENAKLQKKVASLEAKDVTSSNRIKALEKLKVIPETKPVFDIDLARRIAFLFNKGGFEFVDGKAVQVRAPRGKS